MTTPSETALSAEEEADLFAPHDLGCRCYPHVSQRAAIESAVRAATTEYRAARSQPATEGLDVERLAKALTIAGRREGWKVYEDIYYPRLASSIAAEYDRLAATEPAATGETK